MKNNIRTTYYFWLIASGFVVLGILLQSSMFCNTDANWLLHATARFLQGGKYYYNFFETNPPMILYINTLPVLLAKFLHLSMATVFRGYVFLIAIFSSILCAVLIKKIYQARSAWMWRTFVLAIIFIFVFVPAHAFGEREHIALMLVAPYVLLAVLRIRNLRLSMSFIFLIGLLAGIGFAIKPYFIAPFGLIELYIMYKQKRWFAWLRIESLTICTILILYLISIFIFTPEYITKVLPLVWQLYFATVGYSWLAVISSAWVMFFLISVGYYAAFYDRQPYRDFRTVLLLASVGFICAYFLQHTMWFYHALPSYVFSLFLLVQLFQEISEKKIQRFFLAAVILMFAVVVPGMIFCCASAYENSAAVTKEINFIRHNAPNGKIYAFATTIDIPYQIIDKLQVKSVSRFPSQLLLPGLARRLAKARSAKQRAQLDRYKREITNMVTEDLRLYKPDLIIVDQSIEKLLLPHHKFDYFEFFSQNKEFRRIINSYHYVHKIENLAFYRRGK